jgi:hypothetical protein
MLIPAKGAMNAKPLAVEDAFKSISLADMSKRAILNLAPLSVSTEGHFG